MDLTTWIELGLLIPYLDPEDFLFIFRTSSFLLRLWTLHIFGKRKESLLLVFLLLLFLLLLLLLLWNKWIRSINLVLTLPLKWNSYFHKNCFLSPSSFYLLLPFQIQTFFLTLSPYFLISLSLISLSYSHSMLFSCFLLKTFFLITSLTIRQINTI